MRWPCLTRSPYLSFGSLLSSGSAEEDEGRADWAHAGRGAASIAAVHSDRHKPGIPGKKGRRRERMVPASPLHPLQPPRDGERTPSSREFSINPSKLSLLAAGKRRGVHHPLQSQELVVAPGDEGAHSQTRSRLHGQRGGVLVQRD